jgi:hypothetical protein
MLPRQFFVSPQDTTLRDKEPWGNTNPGNERSFRQSPLLTASFAASASAFTAVKEQSKYNTATSDIDQVAQSAKYS